VTDAESADLDALLERYRQVYGVSVHVVTAGGTPFAPTIAPALDDNGQERLDAALAGAGRSRRRCRCRGTTRRW
jgi:hypothetical protein